MCYKCKLYLLEMRYFFLLIPLVLSFSRGYCCHCNELDSIITEYNFSDLVAFGEVLSISIVTPLQTIDTSKQSLNIFKNKNNSPNSPDFINSPMILAVKLKVLKAYKGTTRNQTITIFTPKRGASCGYTGFTKGRNYIVFGMTSSFFLPAFTNYDTLKRINLSNSYWTSNCNRTSEAGCEDLAYLDIIKTSKNR